ncbi:MAG: glycosyltransferase family 4 protein [Verrucomicrobiales bacterium]|nr:glycosyltransferase family 4 protein [Verrucomicrobiales bacterium]
MIRELVKSGKFRLKVFVSQVNRDHFAAIEGIELVECPVEGNNRATRVLYEQLRFQSLAKKEGCDLLFFPGYLGPLRKTMPFVLTVHDMQFRDIPEGFSPLFRGIYDLIVPGALRNADRVLTVSEFSKTRVCHHVDIPPDKVLVSHLSGRDSAAADEVLELSSGDREILDTVENDDRPYLISVSSSFLHKNIDGLADAFKRLNTEGKYRLLLVGVERDDDDDSIISTGYVSTELRDALYRGAVGYVFASRYEGFGLPLLEAMAMGVPVVSSNAGSLPEVGGDACLYFDPDQPEEMIEAMRYLLLDKDLRKQLREAGKERVKKFSWASTAATTERAFTEALRL